MDRFTNQFDPGSLTIKDLLEARDAYHVHLAKLRNVVGTAIGLYRFHPDDPGAHDPRPREAGSFNKEKRLLSSITTRLSLPSVLVLVTGWEDRKKVRCEDYIPPRLYLRDGRVIPTCVLKVRKKVGAAAGPGPVRFPSRLMGGGFPCIMERQKQKRVGTIACLVTDGNLIYALTNRHVAGDKGEEIFTEASKGRVFIGNSSGRSVGKMPFAEVYPGWAGYHAISNLDAGLVELEDVNKWTAQIFRLGIMGEPLDLNTDTMSLSLIDSPLVAQGGASGIMRGHILALFYRYHSLGGADYIADFMIATESDKGGSATRPGDSGTLWFYDHKGDRREGDAEGPGEKQTRKAKRKRPESPPVSQFRPLAMQWGGQVLGDPKSGEGLSFALASNLATVCRLLQVDVVRDWSIGFPEYWGKLGHFAIAQKAVELLPAGKLKTLLSNNLSRITYELQVFTESQVPSYGTANFVPLADVPDLVWKKIAGTHRRPAESGNHYLNLDLRGYGSFGSRYMKTAWADGDLELTPESFTEFYDTRTDQGNHNARGALPFRVWQVYDDMVTALGGTDSNRVAVFLGLAGVLAHYIADACMPLHNTQYHHGYPEATDYEQKVHDYIDNSVLSIQSGGVLTGAFGLINTGQSFRSLAGGREWGREAMELMVDTYEKLSPRDVLDAFNQTEEMSSSQRYDHIIDEIGDPLMECIAEGTFRLAEIWHNAWAEGDGDSLQNTQLGEIAENTLSDLYEDDEDFAPCYNLKDLTVDQGSLVTST